MKYLKLFEKISFEENFEEDFEEDAPRNNEMGYNGGYTKAGLVGRKDKGPLTKKNIINYWKEKWKGTCLENFPNTFIESFPTRKDYREYEEGYYFDHNADEFEFYSEDEVYNIMNDFDIYITNDDEYEKNSNKPYKDRYGYCHISTEDWVDFFNDMWNWK